MAAPKQVVASACFRISNVTLGRPYPHRAFNSRPHPTPAKPMPPQAKTSVVGFSSAGSFGMSSKNKARGCCLQRLQVEPTPAHPLEFLRKREATRRGAKTNRPGAHSAKRLPRQNGSCCSRGRNRFVVAGDVAATLHPISVQQRCRLLPPICGRHLMNRDRFRSPCEADAMTYA
jgi:hypothetical protein